VGTTSPVIVWCAGCQALPGSWRARTQPEHPAGHLRRSFAQVSVLASILQVPFIL
jgi:hypothetical protein